MITKTQLQKELEDNYLERRFLRLNKPHAISMDTSIVSQSCFKRTFISLFERYTLIATYDVRHNTLYILNNSTTDVFSHINILIQFLSGTRKAINKIIYLYPRSDGVVMKDIRYGSTTIYTDDELTQLENEDYYSLIK